MRMASIGASYWSQPLNGRKSAVIVLLGKVYLLLLYLSVSKSKDTCCTWHVGVAKLCQLRILKAPPIGTQKKLEGII